MARALPDSPSSASQAMSRLGHARPAPAVPAVLARRRIGPGGIVASLLAEQVGGVDEDRPVARPPVPAAPRPTQAARRWPRALARLEPVATALPTGLRWARHCLLGAALAFVDASTARLQPVAFMWKNASAVGLGTIYLLLPLASSLALLSHVPSLAQAYDLATLGGAIFLVGLYVSCAFLWLAGTFCFAAAARASLRAARRFAKQGQLAFP